jgi:plastocyanin
VASAKKKPLAQEAKAYPSRRAVRYQQKQSHARNRIIIAISAVLLVAVVVLLVVVATGGDDSPAATAPFDGTTVDVVLGDYVIQGNLTAPAGKVRLQAINQGGIVHNVGIRGQSGGRISGDMKPGGSFTLDLGTLVPGTYQLYCDIAGHVAKGMVANLVITDPNAPPTTVAPTTTT